jgi:putative SOS response-associated peptidase YedK
VGEDRPQEKAAIQHWHGDGGLFAFAGLWERWKDPAGKVIESCTILTTEDNALLKDIHDRMPVILQPGDYDRWLDSRMQPRQASWIC